MFGHFMMNMIMHFKITEQLSQADSTQTTTIHCNDHDAYQDYLTILSTIPYFFSLIVSINTIYSTLVVHLTANFLFR